MIKPTIGRVVWFHPAKGVSDGGFVYHGNDEPLAAIIAHVWNDSMVNLAVFDSNGTSHNRTSVKLFQDGEDKSDYNSYAEWMPYQKGQAAKTEQLEKAQNSGSVNENQEPPVKRYPQPRLA